MDYSQTPLWMQDDLVKDIPREKLEFLSTLFAKGHGKSQKEMMEIAEKMALLGDCVLTPVYHVLEDIEITKEQLLKIKEEHLKRIELADTIFVVNKDDYIGDSTKLEIEYANKLGKKIMYYKDIKTI